VCEVCSLAQTASTRGGRRVNPEGLDPDPIVQFRAWLEEARDVSPNAGSMVLATSSRDGAPSARVVLLRELDEHGFSFFSNRRSRKGGELAENPRAALVFHWWELGRQVRIEGSVEEVPASESEAYWRTRTRASQLAAWASPQSDLLRDRGELDSAVAEAEERFAGRDVPLPPFWGGYRVVPAVIEFWLHRDDRLHDRVRYTRASGGWLRERLAP
jgi:pyridoxamine 5'-phosphate oxidase